MTDAGCLAARDLINAVGPIWDDGNALRSSEMLAGTMYNVIRTARMLCDEHVVVPLVSAGIFGFGATKSANILTQAVIDFYFYWYATQYGEYDNATIAQAVNTTRFKPPRQCTGMYPRRITIVGFYQAPGDYHALVKALNVQRARIAAWRDMQVCLNAHIKAVCLSARLRFDCLDAQRHCHIDWQHAKRNIKS